MKLCVVIPAWNEEQDLPRVLRDIPREIEGLDCVEVVVVDDGSTDRTREYAFQAGADWVVSLRAHCGLATAFQIGLNKALEQGADIVVNLDADYQYLPSEIPALIAPIVEGKADLVIGDRQTAKVKEFSRVKRLLQGLGSEVVRRLAGIGNPIDAVSGFRAFSREAALKLNVVTRFSYTTETIIQAAEKGLAIASVPVTRNHTRRKSRLFGSIWEHVRKTGATILRVYLMYQPLKALSVLAAVLGASGLVLLLRLVLLAVLARDPLAGHMQSLTVGLGLCGMATLVLVLGILADLIAINRRLLEETLERVKRLELDTSGAPANRRAELNELRRRRDVCGNDEVVLKRADGSRVGGCCAVTGEDDAELAGDRGDPGAATGRVAAAERCGVVEEVRKRPPGWVERIGDWQA